MQDHSGMREECQNNTFARTLPGDLKQAVYNFLMTNVHAVKSADGNHRIINPRKFINVIINLHLLCEALNYAFPFLFVMSC